MESHPTTPQMPITFGIITNQQAEAFLRATIESIKTQNIPVYEILVVGDCTLDDPAIRKIPFDESVKKGWITRKKNIICEEARHEIIVLLHDYVKLDAGWYEGFLRFGDEFQFCITPIRNIHGGRFRDFTIYPWGLRAPFQERCLLPYEVQIPDHSRKLLYISGAYYVIKRSVALKYPLDERLVHGAGEDVELSQRLAQNGIYIQCNPYSVVHFMKGKEQCNWEAEIRPEDLSALAGLSEEDATRLFQSQKAHVKGWIASHFGVAV